MLDNHVLAFLFDEARDPDWSPLASARRLIAYAGSDLALLRSARQRLVAADEGLSVSARARVTIYVAIADLEDALGSTGDPEVGGWATVPRPRTPSDAAP